MREIITGSGIPIKPVYRSEDVGTPQPDPGEYPVDHPREGGIGTENDHPGINSNEEIAPEG